MVHAAIHPLTPGSPAYALLKAGAMGGLIAWRIAAARRKGDTDAPQTPADAEPSRDTEEAPGPVRRRKPGRRNSRRNSRR